MSELAEQYRASVEGLVGRAQFDVAHRWNDASAVVWQVRANDCQYALKVHRAANKYAQEREAYETWLPRVEGFANHAPTLVACIDGEPGALLTSWISGEIMTRMILTGEQESVLYEKAGRCLAALHRAHVGSDLASKHHDRVRQKAASRANALRHVLGEGVSAWALKAVETDQSVGISHLVLPGLVKQRRMCSLRSDA